MRQQYEPSAPQQVVYVVQDLTRGKVDKNAIKDAYNVKATTVLGIAHIICGIIAFSCEIDLVVSLSGPRLTVGAGIWSSVFFFISGGLAIGGAMSGRKCLVVATMVMAIISAVCAGVLLIMSALLFEHNTRVPLPGGKSIDALYGLLIAMGATMLLVAIISAALTCPPLCCLQPNHLNLYQPIQTNNQLHQVCNQAVCHKVNGASTNKKLSNGCWEIRNQPTFSFYDDHSHLLCSRTEHRNTNFRNWDAR